MVSSLFWAQTVPKLEPVIYRTPEEVWILSDEVTPPGSFNGLFISGIDLSSIVGELPFYQQLSVISFLVVALLFVIMIISKVLFNIKNNSSGRLIGLFFIGIILLIFNLMVLGNTIDKWEKSGQIDEWIDEGKIIIEDGDYQVLHFKKRYHRY